MGVTGWRTTEAWSLAVHSCTPSVRIAPNTRQPPSDDSLIHLIRWERVPENEDAVRPKKQCISETFASLLSSWGMLTWQGGLALFLREVSPASFVVDLGKGMRSLPGLPGQFMFWHSCRPSRGTLWWWGACLHPFLSPPLQFNLGLA